MRTHHTLLAQRAINQSAKACVFRQYSFKLNIKFLNFDNIVIN